MEVLSVVKLAEGGRLFEGPVWDPRLNRLYWVDILEKSLFSWDSTTNEIKSYQYEAFTSAVMLTSELGKLLVSQDRRIDIIQDGKYVDTLAMLPEPSTNRLNDCKVTRTGTIIAGSMEIDPTSMAGSYYEISYGEVSCLQKGVGIANGSTDLGSTFLLTDSLVGVLREYRKNDQGHPGKVIRSLEKDQLGGIPDGHCFDSDGNLWVALWGGGAVARIDYANWRVLDRIRLPRRNVSSCCIGIVNDDIKLFATCAESSDGKRNAAVYQISFDDVRPTVPFEGFSSFYLG